MTTPETRPYQIVLIIGALIGLFGWAVVLAIFSGACEILS